MSTDILKTKLYIPPLRPETIIRPQLADEINKGTEGKLVLVSAPAGFGKTTAICEWITRFEQPVAWLSLDRDDNNLVRFLIYLIFALQTIEPGIGANILPVLQSPQPPSPEMILTNLVNKIRESMDTFILVVDDYHIIDSEEVNNALIFILEHLPSQIHLILATREDPPLPLARLRSQGQLKEIRADDLRFSNSESEDFFKRIMGLDLSSEHVAILKKRTEGWVAGLQLAGISMQGHENIDDFIKSFTGSHQFIVDYLMDEVLHHQPQSVQTFLMRTSILDRMCGPLCDALLWDIPETGHDILENLINANMFIVPLDSERRWYRYHHLFGELLRQHLDQECTSSAVSNDGVIANLHVRASQWLEDNSLEVEAFHHATQANDIERAERIIEGKGVPLYFRAWDSLAPILNWIKSLPLLLLNENPSLWITYASSLLTNGHSERVEEVLLATEKAIEYKEKDRKIRNIIGCIASLRAMLASMQNQEEVIILQAERALEYLDPENHTFRTAVKYNLSHATFLQGDRKKAKKILCELKYVRHTSGNLVSSLLIQFGLGKLEEANNCLHQAFEIYRQIDESAEEMQLLMLCEVYRGLAYVLYQWNDLELANQYILKSLQQAEQITNTDFKVKSQIFQARIKLAFGDTDGAAAILIRAEQSAKQHNFRHQFPDIAAQQVLVYIHQGNLSKAARIARDHDLPEILARVNLAQGDTRSALEILEPLRKEVTAKGWYREELRIMTLEAVALYRHKDTEKALDLLGEALALVEPEGFIRIFLDEGIDMASLLTKAAKNNIMPDYTKKLLAEFQAEPLMSKNKSNEALIEPLNDRELEILQLIAQGLSNHEICDSLSLALSTVKGYNSSIFDKLHVKRRTEAIARARELDILEDK